MKKNISCHENNSQQAKDYIKTRTEQRFYSLISLPKEKTLSPTERPINKFTHCWLL